MIRVMVEIAELVCSVPKVKWPVSAMRSADSMVSRSRISPISTTSGIFTKRGAQRVGEALGVGVQLALVDHAILVHVHEFDRILDGEDVLVALGVDLVDHGGQRGGLARAGRAGDQHQAARLVAQLADHRRQSELVERLDLERNQTRRTAAVAPR